MEKSLGTAWVGPQIGGAGPQNHQGGANSDSQVDGDSDVGPDYKLCCGRAKKREDGLCPHFCLGESCAPPPPLPPALTLMPDFRELNSVPPRTSVVPYKLLSQCWSSNRASPSKCVCGPIKRNCLEFAATPSGFHCQKLWGLLFPAREPCTGGTGVGLGPLTPQGGTSAAEISLPILNHHMWIWDQPVPYLCPSYQFCCDIFCIY